MQNEQRPPQGAQKYITAVHRRKLVKNCGAGRALEALEMECPERGYPLSSGMGWDLGSQKIFRFCPSKCWTFMHDWTLEQGDSTATVIMMFMIDRLTLAHQCCAV